MYTVNYQYANHILIIILYFYFLFVITSMKYDFFYYEEKSKFLYKKKLKYKKTCIGLVKSISCVTLLMNCNDRR